MTLAAELAAIGTATIGEAWPNACILDRPPRPLAPEMIVAGPALTVRCRPHDNLALHRAIASSSGEGEVLVVDYGGSVESGPFGEIMAVACQMRGIAGLIIHGAVRDSAQIVDLGFPVFAQGLNIRGTEKRDGGALRLPVSMGNALIQPGDMIVADSDGIVVLQAQDSAAALSAAQARLGKEAKILARLRAGETTMQILGLPQLERNS